MKHFLDRLTRAEVDKLTGDFSQLAGVRKLQFCEGPERGMSLLQVHNASGLHVDFLPDRCLDIGQLWFEGIPLAWLGPNGLPPKERASCFDASLGGLLTTCGFDHIRQPEEYRGVIFPMHGSMALEPARVTRCETVFTDNTKEIQIEGAISSFALKRGGLKLRRRIKVPVLESSISLYDQIENVGNDPTEILGMYHFNFGFPLISETTQVSMLANGDRTSVSLQSEIGIVALPETEISIQIANRVGDKVVKVCLQFHGADFPILQTFGVLGSTTNLFCLEPATHDRKSRRDLVVSGEIERTNVNGLVTKHLKVSFSSSGVD